MGGYRKHLRRVSRSEMKRLDHASSVAEIVLIITSGLIILFFVLALAGRIR
jgi:hypothetical protein